MHKYTYVHDQLWKPLVHMYSRLLSAYVFIAEAPRYCFTSCRDLAPPFYHPAFFIAFNSIVCKTLELLMFHSNNNNYKLILLFKIVGIYLICSACAYCFDICWIKSFWRLSVNIFVIICTCLTTAARDKKLIEPPLPQLYLILFGQFEWQLYVPAIQYE